MKKKKGKFYYEMEFIKNEMNFYSYNDFKNQKWILKLLYNRLDEASKQLYMWYVYSREINSSQKAMIWDFLNRDYMV